MSFATARARLVEIVEDTLPTDNRLVGEGCKFVHLPEGRSGIACKSRSFWMESNVDGDGGVTGPYTPDLQGQPRQTFPITLTVSYRLHEKRADLDVLMAADQLALSKELLTQGNWNGSASGILNLTNAPVFLPTRRVVGPESIEMRMAMTLLFR